MLQCTGMLSGKADCIEKATDLFTFTVAERLSRAARDSLSYSYLVGMIYFRRGAVPSASYARFHVRAIDSFELWRLVVEACEIGNSSCRSLAGRVSTP